MSAVVYKYQFAAKLLWVYGCLAALFLAYVHIANNYINQPNLSDWLEGERELSLWLMVAHASTFIITFARFPDPETCPRFTPLFRPTATAIRTGRILLAASTLNVGVIYANGLMRREDAGLASALLLLSAVYTAVHWGLRPENIFPMKLLRLLREGLYPLLFDWWMRPLATRAHIRERVEPLDEWLDKLILCCESAVGVNKWTSRPPNDDDFNYLEFQSHVLDDLESQASLTHYRKELSAAGLREIQNFIVAVESLDHRSPNPVAWQAVVASAKSVLTMRGGLVMR